MKLGKNVIHQIQEDRRNLNHTLRCDAQKNFDDVENMDEWDYWPSGRIMRFYSLLSDMIWQVSDLEPF